MLLTCKCLNVVLETKDNLLPFKKHDVLSDRERSSEFFKNLTLGVIQPTAVCKQHPVLIQMTPIGSWLVFRCLICLWYTHANNTINNEIVVNKALLTMSKEELSVLQKSDDYSSIFNILILDSNEINDENKIISNLNSEFKDLNDDAIIALQNKSKELIRKKELETEELIRNFAEQQYATLNDYRGNVRNECNALTGLLSIRKEYIENLQSQSDYSLTNISMTNHQDQSITVERLSRSRSRTNYENKEIETRRQTSPSSEGELEFACNIPASYDCEGLFPLDGMDSSPREEEEYNSEESTDTEDSASNDEGIHIPKLKNNITIARSVPINVPMDFDPSYEFSENVNTKTKRGRRTRPANIAASMKALANSVHGEMLFGDLPPPRTGSKI